MKKLAIVGLVGVVLVVLGVAVALSSLGPGGLLYERVTAMAAAASGGTLAYKRLSVQGLLTVTVEGLTWHDPAGRTGSAALVALSPTWGAVTGGDPFPVASLVVQGGAFQAPGLTVEGLDLECGRARPGVLRLKTLRTDRLDTGLAVEGRFGPVDPRDMTLDLTATTERGAKLTGQLRAVAAEGAITGRLDFGQAAVAVLVEPTIAVAPSGVLGVGGTLADVRVDPSALSLNLRYPDGEQRVDFPAGALRWTKGTDLVVQGLTVRSGPCQITFDGTVERAAAPERLFQMALGPGSISLPAVVAMLPPSVRASFAGVTPEGVVELSGKLTGQGTPRPALTAKLGGISVARTEGTPFRLELRRGSLAVDGVEDVRLQDVACLINGIPLSVNGSRRTTAGGAPLVQGAIQGERIPLGPLAQLALGGAQKGLADSVRGTVSLDVRAEMSGGAPVLGGSLQLRGAACALPVSTGVVVPVVVGDASVEVSADTIRLRPITVRLGGQPVSIRAQVDRPLSAAPDVSLSLRGERLPAEGLPLRGAEGSLFSRGTVSLVLEATGPVAGPALSGSLSLVGVALRGPGGQDGLVFGGTVGLQGFRLGPAPAGQLRIDDLSVQSGKNLVRSRTLELTLAESGVRLAPATLDVAGATLELALSGPLRPEANPLVLEVTPKGAAGPALSVKAYLDPVKGWHVIALPRPLPLEIHAEQPPAASGRPTVFRLTGAADTELSAFAAWCRSWRVPALSSLAASLEGLGVSGGFRPDLALTQSGARRTVAGSLAVQNVRGSVPAGAAPLALACPGFVLTVLENKLTGAGITVDVGGIPVTVAKLAVADLLGTPNLDVRVETAELPLARALALAPTVALPAGLTLEVPWKATASVLGPWTGPKLEAALTLSPGSVTYRPGTPLPGSLGKRPLTAKLLGGAVRYDGAAVRLDGVALSSDLVALTLGGAVRAPAAERGLFVDGVVTVRAAPLVAALGVALPAGATVKDDLVLNLKLRGTPGAPVVQVSLGKGSAVSLRLPALKAPVTVASLDATWKPGDPLGGKASLAVGQALTVAVSATAPPTGGSAKVFVRAGLPLERLGELVELPKNYAFKGEALLSGEARRSTTGAMTVSGALTCPRQPALTLRTEGGRDLFVTTERVKASFSYAPESSRFRADNLEAQLYGGLVTGNASLDLAGAEPALAFKFLAADVDLGRFMAEGVKQAGLMEGKVGVELQGTSKGLAVESIKSSTGAIDIYDFAVDVNKVAQMSGWASYFPSVGPGDGGGGLSSLLMGAALSHYAKKSNTVATMQIMLGIIKRKHKLGLIQTPVEISRGLFDAKALKSVDDPAALKGRVAFSLQTLALQGNVTLGLKDENYRLTVSNIVLGGTLSAPTGNPANGTKDMSLAPLRPAATPAPTPAAVPTAPAPAPTPAPVPVGGAVPSNPPPPGVPAGGGSAVPSNPLPPGMSTPAAAPVVTAAPTAAPEPAPVATPPPAPPEPPPASTAAEPAPAPSPL